MIFVVLYLIFEYGRPQYILTALGYARIPAICSIILAISWITYKDKVISRPQIKLFFALISLYAISVPFASNNYWAYKALEIFFILCLGFLLPMVTFTNSLKKVNILFSAWIYIHLFLAVLGIKQKGIGIGGFLADENDFALALIMVLPYAFFLAVESRYIRKKIILFSVACIYLITIVYTFSRGGFVGLLVVSFFIWLKSKNKLLGVIILLFLSFSFLIFAPQKYLNEMSTIADTKENTAVSRLYFWEMATNMYLDNPVIGIGPGNFPFKIPLYDFKFQDTGRSAGGRAVHSFFFEMISETGTTGTIIFFLLVFYNLKDIYYIQKIFQRREQLAYFLIKENFELLQDFNEKIRYTYYLSLAFLASMFGYLSAGMFISVFYYPHFWVLTSFIVLTKNYLENYLISIQQQNHIDNP